MIVLGLDLGLRAGAVVLDTSGVLKYSRLIDVSKIKDPGARYCEFEYQVEKILTELTPSVIGYEKVRRHMGTQAAHVYGAFEGILLTLAFESNTPLMPLEVASIKKFATGKGNAKKEAMVACAIQCDREDRGLTDEMTDDNICHLTDDNVADAFWIAKLARRTMLNGPYKG